MDMDNVQKTSYWRELIIGETARKASQRCNQQL
jgi:hypothetical protein